MAKQVDHENKKNQSSWGGARSGAGRPKGSENEETKQRRLTEQHMKRRIVESTDSLLNSQMALAKGEVSLYKKTYVGKGASRRTVIEIVTDQEIIKDFLAETLDEGDNEYYYIATKPPDSKSIDSLLDRTYGKAKQSIDHTSGGEKIIPLLGGETTKED